MNKAVTILSAILVILGIACLAVAWKYLEKAKKEYSSVTGWKPHADFKRDIQIVGGVMIAVGLAGLCYESYKTYGKKSKRRSKRRSSKRSSRGSSRRR